MDKQDILTRLRENEAALKARGVTHAALFGSRARGEDRPDSDIDIMIEIAPDAVQDVFCAVTRCPEIISEASRRLPQDMKDRHPHIPWVEMAAVGNVYRLIIRTWRRRYRCVGFDERRPLR
jgi:predicted nucleotidyltransferase